MDKISNALIYWTVITGIIVLCIFGIYRMMISYERKNRFQFWFVSLLLGGIVLAILFTNELLPGSSAYYNYKFSKSVTGRSMSLGNVYTYESYREPLLGDGYSLYIDKFDQESSNYLLKPSKTFFTDYPFNPKEKSGWITKNWTKCPFDTTDLSYKEFALGETYSYGKSSVTKLDKVQLVVADLLNREGNYYAYRARLLGESVWNISFYVISPKDGWLLTIYNDM